MQTSNIDIIFLESIDLYGVYKYIYKYVHLGTHVSNTLHKVINYTNMHNA